MSKSRFVLIYLASCSRPIGIAESKVHCLGHPPPEGEHSCTDVRWPCPRRSAWRRRRFREGLCASAELRLWTLGNVPLKGVNAFSTCVLHCSIAASPVMHCMETFQKCLHLLNVLDVAVCFAHV